MMLRIPLKLIVSITTILCFLNVSAQQKEAYWIRFTDKNNSHFRIDKPSEFLSQRAINRRIKNNVTITEVDLPVSQLYVDSIRKMGAHVLYCSKWFNAATIEVNDIGVLAKIQTLNFIKSIEKTRDSSSLKSGIEYQKNRFIQSNNQYLSDSSDYGRGYRQIQILNGTVLHQKGMNGKGILIALLDAGFRKAPEYLGLKQTWSKGRIEKTYDFVNPGASVFNEEMHGAAVLSTIASNLNDSLIGTAPDASFLLLHTEDAKSESPVECDNWIAGAEFADSAGADIISSSLGYNDFDNPACNFNYGSEKEQLARISLAAEIANSKGMVVMVSAGNDGDKSYHYIGTPANAKNILAVGAVTPQSLHAAFSSYGPSSDGRVKPDVVAMGQQVTCETSPGAFTTLSGTSLACPITAGLVACLMQAYPNSTAQKIRETVIKSSSQYLKPDSAMGYGIPDFGKAFDMLGKESPLYSIKGYAYPNPFSNKLTLVNQFKPDETISIECYNLTGEKLFSVSKFGGYSILQDEISCLESGTYYFRCIGKNETISILAVKVSTSK